MSSSSGGMGGSMGPSPDGDAKRSRPPVPEASTAAVRRRGGSSTNQVAPRSETGESLVGTGRGDEREAPSPAKAPSKLSSKKSRAKDNQAPEKIRLQITIAAQLKADSASGTLEAFDEAMAKGLPLPSKLLCGVLNQAAKAGRMDDCARVLDEIKRRGIVLEENMYVPLVRGLVCEGDSEGAFKLVQDMVKQGVQPRLRCYEPILALMSTEGNMDEAKKVWEHMEENEVIPREDQYVDFLGGLGKSGELWKYARSGELDELFSGMSYRARNITSSHAELLLQVVNNASVRAIPSPLPSSPPSRSEESHGASRGTDTGAEPPLASFVKIGGVGGAGGGSDDDGDDDGEGWPHDWSGGHGVKRVPAPSCPACGGVLEAVGLQPSERARIRDTLFDLAGLQVKKHSKSRWTKRTKSHNKSEEDSALIDSGYYSFTEEDQIEQLQLFVDWLNHQRASGNTFTTVIDSANVAYHRGNPWHFSLPKVDVMVQALEAMGERPLVIIAERYMDRVDETNQGRSTTSSRFRYMRTPLNKSIVNRWRSRGQVYECSDEASDDWYWLYAAVAFDDMPMTVISNDRTRDHRLSLAEPVPFLRWRTTQLARFDIVTVANATTTQGTKQEGKREDGQVWHPKSPTVSIEAPPAFTRDIQRSKEGCWHLPVGSRDDWLCLDIPRGLRLGLDRLPDQRRLTPQQRLEPSDLTPQDGHLQGAPAHDSALGPLTDGLGGSEDEDRMDEMMAGAEVESSGCEGEHREAKMRRVGGILQSMAVKQKTERVRVQGAVQAAAAARDAARAAAARGSAAAPEADSSGSSDASGPAASRVAGLAQSREGSGTKSRPGRTGKRSRGGNRIASRAVDPSDPNGVVVEGREPATPSDAMVARGVGLKGRTGVLELQARGVSHATIAETAPSPKDGQGPPVDQCDNISVDGGVSGIEAQHGYGAGGAGGEGGDGAGEHLSSGIGDKHDGEVDWGSMTVLALRDALRARGLKVSGNKAELVERLSGR